MVLNRKGLRDIPVLQLFEYKSSPLQHQGIKIYDQPRFHQLLLVQQQALQEPQMLFPAKRGNFPKSEMICSSLIDLRKLRLNGNLNIIIENQMCCAIFSKQIEGIVVCKIFKLQKSLKIQKTLNLTYKQTHHIFQPIFHSYLRSS